MTTTDTRDVAATVDQVRVLTTLYYVFELTGVRGLLSCLLCDEVCMLYCNLVFVVSLDNQLQGFPHGLPIFKGVIWGCSSLP